MNKSEMPFIGENGSFEQRFFLLFVRIYRLLRLHGDQNMTANDLSPAQAWFLGRLADAGAPQPISYFADGVFSNRSNATQMIDRLEAEGLVRRIRNPKDRRSVLVELQDSGLQRLLEGLERRETLLRALLKPLTDAERDATLHVFERLLSLLEHHQDHLDQELSNDTSRLRDSIHIDHQ